MSIPNSGEIGSQMGLPPFPKARNHPRPAPACGEA